MTESGADGSRAGSPSRWFWILNADCELEFERPENYQSSRLTQATLSRQLAALHSLTQGEPWAFPHECRSASQPLAALLWSPTPSAVAAARRAGLHVGKSPPLDVLRRVNDKSFLGSVLPRSVHPERRLIESESAFASARLLASGPLRVRRRFGFAGRGSRVIPVAPSADDLRFLGDSLRRAPLVVEPQLCARAEWSIHGVVHEDGLLLGSRCQLWTDSRGAPLGAPRAASAPTQNDPLEALAEQAASELLRAGYQGPFGIDFLETEEGLFAIDLNARFTLGFSAGMGPNRAQALSLCLGLRGPDLTSLDVSTHS